jgi:hypothetical protein
MGWGSETGKGIWNWDGDLKWGWGSGMGMGIWNGDGYLEWGWKYEMGMGIWNGDGDLEWARYPQGPLTAGKNLTHSIILYRFDFYSTRWGEK